MDQTTDAKGRPVAKGSMVRVLGFQEGLFKSMPEDEVPYVQSFLGEVLEVEEIDESGVAWVWKSWPQADGHCQTHGVGLEPHLMELVTPGSSVIRIETKADETPPDA